MSEVKTGLSKYKEVICIHCHDYLTLDLAERRGEKEILCPLCKKTYKISEVENFMSSLSPTFEGQCPNCYATLDFDLRDRIPQNLIACPRCSDSFYINEAIVNKHTIPKKEFNPRKEGDNDILNTDARILLKNYKIYIILSIFLDFLLIFTFLSIGESNRIKKELQYWSGEDILSYNTWNTVFRVLVIMKILLIVLALIQAIVDS